MFQRTRTLQTALLHEGDRRSLTPSELEALAALNAQLAEVEVFLAGEYIRLQDALTGRCTDRRNGLSSFNLEGSIGLCLREDDPAWSDDSDSLLWQDARFMLPLGDFGCRIEERPADLPRLPVEPCGLLHHLEHPGHMGIPHRDLLRVGRIWVDVHVDLQRFYSLPGPGWELRG